MPCWSRHQNNSKEGDEHSKRLYGLSQSREIVSNEEGYSEMRYQSEAETAKIRNSR